MLAQIAWYPDQASTTAEHVDLLFYFLTSITGAVGLLVAFLLIFFSIRYRRRVGQALPPAYTHPSRPLELFWTITPLFIFMVMFVWGATVYFGAYRPPDDAAPIYVVGKQWMWKFQHPEGQREINSLHVPVGRPVRLVLTSEDVIHSFFCPEFRIHMDVLPERYTSVWFQTTHAGTFHLFCSQYCGTNHASMIGTVVALEPAEFQRWLHRDAEGSMALEGRKIFLKYRCISCHVAENGHAPVLEDLWGKEVLLRDGTTTQFDETYVMDSIWYPHKQIVFGYDDIMPTFKGQVSQEEIYELIAYFKSLHQPCQGAKCSAKMASGVGIQRDLARKPPCCSTAFSIVSSKRALSR